MEIKKDVWRIAEFGQIANELFQEKHGVNDKVHHNTIDKWFKEMEDSRTHYVQRIADRKLYDNMDLKIALFIMDCRLEKWSLEGIYNAISSNVEVRPFPEEYEFQSPILSEQHFINLLESKMSEYKESILMELEQKMTKQLKLSLPKEKTEKELEEEALARKIEKKEMMLNWAKKQLEFKAQAVKEWEQLDFKDRMREVGGFFKKKYEEDLVKRDKFIDEFIRKQVVQLSGDKNEL